MIPSPTTILDDKTTTAIAAVICEDDSILCRLFQNLRAFGHTVTFLSTADAKRHLIATEEITDVVIVEAGLVTPEFEEVMDWCQQNLHISWAVINVDRNAETVLAYHRKRCVHLSGPINENLLNILAPIAAGVKRRERHWYKRLVELETQASERARNLEQARERAEQSYKELQQTQSQLLQTEKLASIGQLAAGVAHEINNPIGFIYSNMNTLCDYVRDLQTFFDKADAVHKALHDKDEAAANRALQELDEWRRDSEIDYVLEDLESLVSETIDGAERVKRIVMDLRTFSRAEDDHKAAADINKGLESTINVCWNELKYRCEVVKDLGDIPEIVCFPMKLNQVFMNLIVNAAHAIEDSGTITVRTFAHKSNVVIQIEDNGCGIPESVRKRIFDPFFTTKPAGKGTGLGLSIVHNIIAEHDGEITVESEEGEGTTFTIVLPIKEA